MTGRELSDKLNYLGMEEELGSWPWKKNWKQQKKLR